MANDRGQEDMSNQLKAEMQIVATKVRMKGTITSKLPRSSKKSDTFTISSVKRSPLKVVHNSDMGKQKQSTKIASKRKKKFIRHPVDYTWNMGGRLKEIRIRTQARKFLYIWKKKTFGQMTFSEAKEHHRKLLCRKHFQEWKSFWWDSCGEWKLLCKAEYYHKFQVYRQIWSVWKTFSLDQKQKNQKYAIAQQHHNMSLCKRGIKQWKMYVQVRNVKKKMYSVGYNKANHTRIKNAWVVWTNSYKQRVVDKTNGNVAAFHWATTTMKRVLDQWVVCHKERLLCQKQMSLALRHNQASILHQTFKCWYSYMSMRRKTSMVKQQAKKFYVTNLKKRTLHHMQKRYQSRLSHEIKMERCFHMAVRSIKRRSFMRWLDYIEMTNMNRRKLAIANIHCKKQLMKKSFSCLLASVAHRRLTIRRKHTASNFYQTILKVNAWKCWQVRMEAIEEKSLSQLTVVANAHFCIKLLGKAMARFKENVLQQKLRHRQVVKAEAHFAVKALPNCFRRWKIFVHDTKLVKEMKTDASKFRSDVLTSKCFYAWWSRFDTAKEVRTMQRMAIMQCNDNLLSVHFKVWVTKVRRILTVNKHDAVARVHYRRALLADAVRNWKLHVRQILERRKKYLFAESYYRNSSVAGAWLAWRQFIDDRRKKRAKVKQAEDHHSLQLLTNCLSAWTDYHKQSIAIKVEVQQRFKHKQLSVTKSIFVVWRKGCRAAVEKRVLLRRAEKHRSEAVQSFVFTKWREWAALHYYKKQQMEEKLQQAGAILRTIKLRACFRRWREAKNVLQHQKTMDSRAKQHYESKVRTIAFQAWILYRYVKLKQQLMACQSQRHCDCRIVKNSFNKWRTALADRDEENAKTSDALWHWALTLQSKCLERWVCYAKERKRKKGRYADAMDRRRYRMLKEGCTSMLRYHSDMLAMRTKAAACQQAKMSYTAYHLAWKYGKRWIGHVREKMRKAESAARSNNFVRDDFYAKFTFSPERNPSPWIPRPTASLYDFTVQSSIQPSKGLAEKRVKRPSPKLPQFLDESLQREGIFVVREQGSCDQLSRFPRPSEPDDECEPTPSNTISPTTKNDINTEVHVSPEVNLQTNSAALLPSASDSVAYLPGLAKETPTSTAAQPDDSILPSNSVLPTEPTAPAMSFAGRGTELPLSNTVDGPSDMVLLPPSAFTVPPGSSVPSSSSYFPHLAHEASGYHDNPSPCDRHRPPFVTSATDRRQRSASNFDQSPESAFPPPGSESDASSSPLSHQDSGRRLGESNSGGDIGHSPGSCVDKVTSKTFIASPSASPVKDELVSIHEQLKEFQQLKQRLKVLKQQKQVLQSWLHDSLSTAAPSASLDVGSVEAEIQQIEKESKETSQQLIARKPIVENLALRVRVLCARPT